MSTRRGWLIGAAGAAAAGLIGCDRTPDVSASGGFTGTAWDGAEAGGAPRGHRVRSPATDIATAQPAVTHRVHTVVAGGGIAGLAAARALRLGGISDWALLELEDQPGGNSRGTVVGGLPCPLGAHYLPVPGAHATHVQAFLAEQGVCQWRHGRWVYDERMLCHSPQERLFFNGAWQEGLLPLQGVGAATLAQYRRFAQTVQALRQRAPFAMPASARPFLPQHAALDAATFQSWLHQQGLNDTLLLAHLDYCCRDDYGAGIAQVSAWGGLHYFASRHGFQVPGDDHTANDSDSDASHGVLTWPQGNGWLTERLRAGDEGRIRIGHVVLRIAVEKYGVAVDAFNSAAQRTERWLAAHCIVALPAHVAARVVIPAWDVLTAAAQRTPHAAWVVTNLHLPTPLWDRPGAPPSWDNVVHGSAGLGYVDATHQSLRPVPGATVLTHYRALGAGADVRQRLLTQPWTAWRDAALAELSEPHPDLATKVRHTTVTRHAHAMAVPAPGLQTWLRALPQRQGVIAQGRLSWAHADASGYSVFEEAFTRGHLAGLMVANSQSKLIQ